MEEKKEEIKGGEKEGWRRRGKELGLGPGRKKKVVGLRRWWVE